MSDPIEIRIQKAHQHYREEMAKIDRQKKLILKVGICVSALWLGINAVIFIASLT